MILFYIFDLSLYEKLLYFWYSYIHIKINLKLIIFSRNSQQYFRISFISGINNSFPRLRV